MKRASRPRHAPTVIDVHVSIPLALSLAPIEDALVDIMCATESFRRACYQQLSRYRTDRGETPWPLVGEHVPRSPMLIVDALTGLLARQGWKMTADMPVPNTSCIMARSWCVELTRHQQGCGTLRTDEEASCLCGAPAQLDRRTFIGFDSATTLAMAWMVLHHDSSLLVTR